LTEFAAQKIECSKRCTLVVPALAAGLLALTALPFIFFATFGEDPKIFDDEGTLMITFREILDGRVLYHDISALYGPFYYCIIAPLFSLLGVPLSHDAVRLVSATLWFCCIVTFATLAWRLTGSAIVASFAGLIALFFLKLFVHSPLHPQELSFLLIGILLHLLVSAEKEPKPIVLALIGTIVGGLLLIKINLATFVILPLVLGALRATSDRSHVRAFHGVVLALSLLLPVALMAPLFRLQWVIWYCVFASGTILAALVVWSSGRIPKIFTIKDWGYCVCGIAAVVLSTLCVTIAYGTTVFEIFRATVLQNFDLVQNWYLAAPVSSGAIAITVISLAYATLLALSRTRAINREATLGRVIRLKAGIAILGSLSIAIAAAFGTPW
jgi:4-amino-4-deoxy-L-arabinose transferase-like glycosyltransferase